MDRLGRGSAFWVLLLFGLGLLAAANVATATTFQVGGGLGNWTIPSSINKIDYQTWANSQKFKFGDEIVFNYQNDTHDVLLVSNSTAYAACDINVDDAVLVYDSGEDVIELNKGPHYYFICGTPGHCSAGQKFNITVAGYVPPPIPNTPTIASPPPSGSPRSLPHIGLLILSIAMVFCTPFVL